MVVALVFFASLSLALFIALAQSWAEIAELERLNTIRAIALECASDTPLGSSWPRLVSILKAGVEGFLLYDPDVAARMVAPSLRRQDEVIESYLEFLEGKDG